MQVVLLLHIGIIITAFRCMYVCLYLNEFS